MTALLLGVLVLIAVLSVLRWFGRTDVKTVRKAINWGGLGLIALVILFLVLTGRMGAAIAGVMALFAWGSRLLGLIHMGRQMSGMFRSFGFSRGGGTAAGQVSEVDSVFLRMTLDHASGAMEGEVKSGRFNGKRLAQLDRTDLLALLQEVGGDQDSVGLMEAYLDRRYPDWRDTEAAPGAAPAPQGTMTAEEAYRILGLKPGAADDDIKSAYRRLMGQLHPDHGGSDYLAAKVNQAKDFLLKKRV